MMKFRRTGQNTMEMRSGGGCFMTLFGFPFLAAGVFVMGASLGLWAQKGDMPPWFFGIPFGGVFAMLGTGLMLGRAGVRIDLTRKTITKWWGLLVPFKGKKFDLDEYDHVGISREVRRSKNSTYTVYPVRIVGGEKPINVGEPRRYEESRRGAEELAKFIGCKLVDTSSGQRVVREAGKLDDSLRDRARRAGELAEMPEPPPNMRTRCNIQGRRVVLDFPRAGFGVGSVITVVAALVLPAAIYFGFLQDNFEDILKQPPPMNYIVLGMLCLMMGLPSVAMLIGVISRALGHRRVIASPESLRVERRGLLFTRVQEIPASELEELLLPGRSEADAARATIEKAKMPQAARHVLSSLARGRPQAIRARSDRVSVEFGAGLPADEIAWVHAVIMRMMTV